MYGVNKHHVWLRGIQRIIGTFLALVLTWLLISFNPSELMAIITIAVLQIIIETLIVKNYTITVIFITALTIFFGRQWT